MLLPSAVFFPNTILPLYIFEPRYRRMLAECLEGDRIFGVVMVRAEARTVSSAKDVHSVGGVGLIRACVAQPDGTSSLVLQGIERVRIRTFDRTKPYWTGEIEIMENSPPTSETALLEESVLRACRSFGRLGEDFLPQLKGYMPGCSDAGILSDLVASEIITDSVMRQELLAEANVDERLRILAGCLSKK